MKKYPLLALLKRHGAVGSALSASFVAIASAYLLWPFLGIDALLAAALAGGLVLFLGLVLVELVKMTTDLLIPE